MRVHIVGTDLPGGGLYVAVQRGREFEGLTPATADGVTFEFDVGLVGARTADDVRGPYVHGRRGDRFFYIAWVAPDETGGWEIVRRAKIHPAEAPPKVWSAVAGGAVLEVTLPLTDEDGGPRCATADRWCTWRALDG